MRAYSFPCEADIARIGQRPGRRAARSTMNQNSSSQDGAMPARLPACAGRSAGIPATALERARPAPPAARPRGRRGAANGNPARPA
jgi:hypothetical protein